MKKAISFILSCALCFWLTIPAMAATMNSDRGYYKLSNPSTGTWELRYNLPEYNTEKEDWDFRPMTYTVNLVPAGTVVKATYGNRLSITSYVEKDGEWVKFSSSEKLDSVTIEEDGEVYHIQSIGISSSGFSVIFDNGIWLKADGAVSPAISSASFTDVAADAYYADAVKWAVEKEVTSGTTATTFSPNDTCTKAQILTFLWRASGSPEPSIPNCFEDVNESAYYYKAAVWACENGLVMNRWFGGDAPCTRIETVTYLWTLAGQPTPANSVAFTDLPDDADSIQAVAWAVEKEITSGTSMITFAPDTTCTRGQIVTFLYRSMAQ